MKLPRDLAVIVGRVELCGKLLLCCLGLQQRDILAVSSVSSYLHCNTCDLGVAMHLRGHSSVLQGRAVTCLFVLAAGCLR